MIKPGVIVAIITATSMPALTANTATENQCHKVVALLDQSPELERFDPFDELSPAYIVRLDEKGSMNVSCSTGHVDFTIGINSVKPSQHFMTFFGALAHDVAGINSKGAIEAALQCHNSALQYKGSNDGLFIGDRIDKPALHVDCRVGNAFTSFGAYHP